MSATYEIEPSVPARDNTRTFRAFVYSLGALGAGLIVTASLAAPTTVLPVLAIAVGGIVTAKIVAERILR